MSARIVPEPRLPNPKRQFIPNHGPFLMTHTFEHAELSVDTGFHERGEDRLRDEKDRSRTDDAGCPSDRSLDLRRSVTTLRSVLLIIAFLVALPMLTRAQSLTDSGSSSGAVASATATTQLDLTYTRPTQTTKLHNYFFDAFGPYPIVGAAVAAGISQVDNAPPEWKQGVEGYGKRFGSAFAIASGKHHDALCAGRSLQGRHVCITAVSVTVCFRGSSMQ